MKELYGPIRERLAEKPTHWRSLEHKEGHASVLESFETEFPQGITSTEGFNRRDVLKLAAASAALGAAACVRRPEEEILPFTKAPEQAIPGVRLMYATAMPRSEGALGLLVESHEGRPTKIEGNPNHPASLGSTDVWAQAEILRLYDPERARRPRQGGQDATWEAWDAFATTLAQDLQKDGGQGFAFLVEDGHGPTFERLLRAGTAKLPNAKVFRWDPLGADGARLAAQLAFGPGARVHHDLDKAQVIFALDSDFLIEGPDHVRLARQFGQKRNVQAAGDVKKMNRLYVAEGVYSATGANADHRARVSSAQAPDLLRALAKRLAGQGVALGELGGGNVPAGTEKFLDALAKDLAAAQGAVAILVGDRQPAEVQALGHAIAAALGAGRTGALTVSRGHDATPRTGQFEGLQALTAALQGGAVHTLFIVEANPLFTAPGALRFGDALAKAKTVIHAGVLFDETAQKAHWHLPAAHFLEAWGDAEAWDGTASLVQPLILPLHGARAVTSLLAQLTGHPERHDGKLVEQTWRGEGGPLADLRAWQKALHDGVIPNTARTAAPAEPDLAAVAQAVAALKPAQVGAEALELVAYRSHLRDGRMANVPWLIELPDSMTKLSWDNALIFSPRLAKALGIGSGVTKNGYEADEVELSAGGRTLRGPAFVLPGYAEFTVGIATGYGRQAGAVARGVGVDPNPFLADGRGVVHGVSAKRTGKTQVLCSTQDHFSVPANPFKELTFAEMAAAQEARERQLGLGSRPLFRGGTAAEFEKAPEQIADEGGILPSLLQAEQPKTQRPSQPVQPVGEIVYEGQQWGMTIDLSTCIGCSACVVACYAENNIPTVGREQVLLGREMAWIRIDRYFAGDVEEPKALHQPVPCMHCENAPCEPVCPVSATVHDEEGLNTMAYNRCIGTRYCSNNCPYKVRRFNYLDFTKTGNFYVPQSDAERMKTLKLQRNPDVTVRYRGVMEKCTYCTQRIDEAKIAAKRAGGNRKDLPDGAVVPACAQVCPTRAITFGNINNPQAAVAKLKAGPRSYEMLQELNTRPRTSYLARIRNANEELS